MRKGTTLVILSTGDSIKITSKEPGRVKRGDTTKRDLEEFFFREHLGVVDHGENPSLVIQGDDKMKGQTGSGHRGYHANSFFSRGQ